MAYIGIDYASGTGSNTDPKTGIRYGVISQHSVSQDAADDLELGPKARAYFRMLSGRDSTEDGPEVEIIRAVTQVHIEYARVPIIGTFNGWRLVPFLVSEDV